MKFTAPLIALSLDLLGNLLRFIFAVDPHGMRSIYDPFSALFWATPQATVGLICHFIVLYYWNRAVSSFGAKNLDSLRNYFYGLIVLIIFGELVVSSLKAVEIGFIVIIIYQVFYIILEALIIAYIVYTAVQLRNYFRDQRRLKGHRNESSQRRAEQKVIRMTKLLVIVAGILVITIVVSALGILEIFRYPATEMILWLILYTTLASIAICQAILLQPGSKEKDSKVSTIGTTEESLKTSDTSVSSPRNHQRVESRKVATSDSIKSESETSNEIEKEAENAERKIDSKSENPRFESESTSLVSSSESTSDS